MHMTFWFGCAGQEIIREFLPVMAVSTNRDVYRLSRILTRKMFRILSGSFWSDKDKFVLISQIFQHVPFRGGEGGF